jgi:hypothetical protein
MGIMCVEMKAKVELKLQQASLDKEQSILHP